MSSRRPSVSNNGAIGRLSDADRQGAEQVYCIHIRALENLKVRSRISSLPVLDYPGWLSAAEEPENSQELQASKYLHQVPKKTLDFPL